MNWLAWFACRIGFSSKSTSIWFLGYYNKYRFLLLFCPTKERCVFSDVNSPWQTQSTASAHWLATKAQTSQRPTICSSPPLEDSGIFHTRRICQWYPKCTSSVFPNNSANFLHVFTCTTCGGMTWTFTIFNQSFPYLKQVNQSQVLFSQRHYYWKPFWAFHVFPMTFSQVWSTVPSNQPFKNHNHTYIQNKINTHWLMERMKAANSKDWHRIHWYYST